MMCLKEKFQSTYLYKVRLKLIISILIPLCFNPRTYIRYDLLIASVLILSILFQSTYLYKVRRSCRHVRLLSLSSFNPRTYIRYDPPAARISAARLCFNPRTYIRYDSIRKGTCYRIRSFNPRTYIRYDRP